jgi:hypothetical protein
MPRRNRRSDGLLVTKLARSLGLLKVIPERQAMWVLIDGVGWVKQLEQSRLSLTEVNNLKETGQKIEPKF